MFHSVRRQISGTSPKIKEPTVGTIAYNEMDTNADTCCLGKNFIPIGYTYRTADVYPYDTSIAPVTNVPIVSGATAWKDPYSLDTYILIFHESLYYGNKLDHSLINPNQVRHAGVPLWDNPYDSHHDLSIETKLATIPLNTNGTKITFETYVPIDHEFNTCPRIHMTERTPWQPSEVRLGAVYAFRLTQI